MHKTTYGRFSIALPQLTLRRMNPTDVPGQAEPSSEPAARTQYREIQFRHSSQFVPILRSLRCSLLVSTYAAGKLAVVGTDASGLTLAFQNFDQCMGVAVGKKLAVGTRHQIWFLNRANDLANQMQPSGRYDSCFLTRLSFVTGRIHGHELAWAGDTLWVVNTLFSCLCTLADDFSFVPQWKPPFISSLEANDRCHLNGLALVNGSPRFVTVMAESDEPGGWRATKETSGCIVDVSSGATVARGFCMPHSPRFHNGSLLVLDSGRGQMGRVDTQSGKYQVIESFPGYTRGMTFVGGFAFVGLSQIRETAVFGGVPIAEKRDELRCGVAVVDMNTGRSVAYLEFISGVNEIFAVEAIPDSSQPAIVGPFPDADDRQDVWVIPPVKKQGHG
jgi:uncharacterized protein (TIGR03032 family)